MSVCVACSQSSTASDPPLLTAVRADSLDQVQKLLAAGANVNEKSGEKGASALVVAAIRGNLPIVQALVNKGANVNIQNTACVLLLFHAPFSI
jgi:ankyrin repeat protein